MGFGITGYLLEPPRVGSGNSIYTSGPNNGVTDTGDWNTAYPTDESNPADAYLVLVPDEGTGKLPSAKFAWTRNDLIPRFDYDARKSRFWLMPGAAPDVVGLLGPDSNTSRLRVVPPRTDQLAACPVRVSPTVSGTSGPTMLVSIVTADANFTPSPGPPSGTVEISMATGNLNWADSDLVTFDGRTVTFQRQVPRAIGEVSGTIGKVGELLLMSPLPATGQHPAIHIGSRRWMTDVEVPNEASFTNPPSGSFQWARDTGRVNLNTGDVVTYAGSTVVMDGILLATDLVLTDQVLGTVAVPGTLPTVPSAGGDIIVRATFGSEFYQFRYVSLVDAFPGNLNEISPPDVQIRKSDGAIAFNPLQTAFRGTWLLHVVVCDLPVDHGVSLRLFRCPVDLQGTNDDLKDVASLYEATGATFADPIIGAPQVFLPAQPLEDLPMVVKVEQGTGFFLSEDLPNLRTSTPSGTRVPGYLIDLDEGLLRYAQRRNDHIVNRPVDSGSAQLPEGFVQDFHRTIELEDTAGVGDWQPLDLTNDAYIEPLSGVITFTETFGELLASGSNASLAGTTLSAPGAAFTAGLVGKWVILPTLQAVYGIVAVPTTTTLTLDASAGLVFGPLAYEVREDANILADRYFETIVLEDPDTKVERILPLGTITNWPRLWIDTAWLGRVRFRYGSGSFSTTVTQVTGSFSAPGSMAAGTVEMDTVTGELNFAQADVDDGGTVWWARKLKQGVDYKLQAALGLIEFTERMLIGEQGLITYKTQDATAYVEEPMRFLIRKELTPPRSAQTSSVSFNPVGRLVADTPAPTVFRGGRPQAADQVSVNTTTSTVTFLSDRHLDGLLPHGAIVAPVENVYVDYYVLEAVGGEQTASVLQPPMVVAQANITGGDTSFQVSGDWTASFKPNRILRIDKGEVHYIQSVAHASGVTTITISSGESFRDDWTAPPLAQSSGTTRVTGVLFQRAYFTSDLGQFQPVPRGQNRVRFLGDRTGDYQTGTVMRITSGTDVELALVTGSAYGVDKNLTEVTLATNVLRQYVWGLVTVQRSVRPILDASATTVQTAKVPVPAGDPAVPQAMQNVQVFRKVEGQPGVLLDQQTGYFMDGSGQVTFFSPMQPDEEWGIFYSGHRIVDAGRRLRASYVAVIAPDFTNGLAGQALVADYWTWLPDTFFYRVVRISEYRAEVAAKYAKAARESAPSGGPMLSNSSSPSLPEQGNPSPYYPEGVLANEDVAARYTLKFYNDLVNTLEDVLQGMDGRIVGGRDGRFLFDGVVGMLRTTWASVENQVDDILKVSDAPYQITFAFPVFSITSIGTYQQVYLPSAYSRFYPTWRRRHGVTGVGVQTGDPVLDTGSTNLTAVQNLRTRLAWAQVTTPAQAADTVLFVDNAEGSATVVRPPFAAGMEVVVQLGDGTFLVNELAPLTVAVVASNSLTLAGPLGVDIPAGATVYRSWIDASVAVPVLTNYMAGRDYAVNPETGQILYIVPFPPFDGSNPLVPVPLQAQPLPAATPMSLEVTLSNGNLAPEKIPMLYGGTTDDDGEDVLPLIGPDLMCEATTVDPPAMQAGLIPDELAVVGVGGTLLAATTAPYVRTGSLDVTRTVITLALPLPLAPLQYDLVRITSGLNGATSFHRIQSALVGSITVEHPFAVQDAGFTCQVAMSPPLETGAASLAGSTLTDMAATFVTNGVVPGHTVVITSGAHAGRRLQVAQVLGETQLLYETAVAGPVAGNYRVINPLATFGSLGNTGTLLDALAAKVAQLLQVLQSRTVPVDAEMLAIEAYYDLVFTYLSTGTGAFALGGTTLTDGGADFVTDGVQAGDVVYIRSGLTVMGVYEVDTVTGPTTLEVVQPFPDVGVGVPYKVGRPYGSSFEAMGYIMDVLRGIDQLVVQTVTFLSLMTTPVNVIITGGGTDPLAFARGTTQTDLTMREAVLQARLIDLGAVGSKATVADVLLSDFMYDKRYAWLDARINRQTGILTSKTLAAQQRLEIQAQAVLQMVKLLSMGTL